jgi:hypothetical protein
VTKGKLSISLMLLNGGGIDLHVDNGAGDDLYHQMRITFLFFFHIFGVQSTRTATMHL